MEKRPENSLVILGIDPGLAHTGWGVIEQRASVCRCMAYGCVTTPASDSTHLRLATIYEKIGWVIERYHPVELGIEDIFFGINAKTAFATGQARGAALVACSQGGLEVGEYTPQQIKLAVAGTGSATKEQVQYMVRAVLALDHEPKPDHAADALAAAVCHANLRAAALLERRVAQAQPRSGDGVRGKGRMEP